MYDVLIIGGGIAGLSAGMYAGRLKMKTLLLVEARGGTIANTNDITNWPGISKIDGMTLAKQLEQHAKEYAIEIKDTVATEIKKTATGFEVVTPSASYAAKTLLFATGTEVRKLGVKGEAEFANRGVHYCGLCDGFFYTDKTIAVVGGSDSAAKEALLLTQWAKKVYIIYRKDQIRAEPITLEKVKANKKIEIISNTNVMEIVGDDKGVKKLLFDKAHKGSKDFAIDGVFVEIGRVPNSALAKPLGVKLNAAGEIITDKDAKTNVAGIFAAGDVTDISFKQGIVASAEGVTAAYGAYQHLQK
jgi:thioredoxin reductase (NADPH)